jgi:hypothetical protein
MAAPSILRGFTRDWDKQTPEQLSCQVDFAGPSPQKSGFLVDIWSLTVAEIRAHNERSGVYLSQVPGIRFNTCFSGQGAPGCDTD